MPIIPVLLRLPVAASLAAMSAVPPGGASAFAQEARLYEDARVANFAAAERMDGNHLPVTLSFWSGPRGKAIDYDPGDGSGAVRLHPLGRATDGKGLRVRTPEGSIWIITLSDGVLLLHDHRTSRPRVFLWRYQGPIDGRGTACDHCVDEKEALTFVMRKFVLNLPSDQ